MCSALGQTIKSPDGLYEMSVKYQEHQFSLAIIPSPSVSLLRAARKCHKLSEQQLAYRYYSDLFPPLRKETSGAEISDSDTGKELLDFYGELSGGRQQLKFSFTELFICEIDFTIFVFE